MKRSTRGTSVVTSLHAPPAQIWRIWAGRGASPMLTFYGGELLDRFSWAMHWINTAMASSTGGRPVRFGYIHFRATRRRCQRSTVPGVTNWCARSSSAAAGSARRRPPGRPSPSGVSGWFCAARPPRDAAPGVQRSWMPKSDRVTPVSPQAARRSDKVNAVTRLAIMPWPPRADHRRSDTLTDFWNPTRMNRVPIREPMRKR
jgi:hypothetical protein